MSANVIPKRYAKALLSIADTPQEMEAIGKELGIMSEMLSNDEEIRKRLTSPLYPKPSKIKLLDEIIHAAGFSANVQNFLKLLLEKERLVFLKQIVQEFDGLLNEKLGVSRVQLITAKSLASEQQKAIQAALQNKMGNKIVLETDVDESLIGGAVIKLGSRVIDGSVLSLIQRMGNTLAKG